MAKKKIDIEKLELEQDDYEYEKKLAEEERIAKQQREERLAAEEAS